MKIFRMSSMPVMPADLQAHKEEWTTRYDVLALKYAKPDDMKTLQVECEKLATELNAKYKFIDNVQLPKSAKAWKAMIDLYEAPVLIAKSSDNPNEAVLVIIDQPIA